MIITLTIDDLRRKDACSDGVEMFRKVFGESIDLEWDREHQEYLLLTDFRKYVGWAWAVGLLPQWTLNGWVMYGAELYGADLYGADLRGANLYGSDLRGADLRGANLYGADLRGADLYGADLYGANLYGANLYGADLYGANLYGADLRYADLRGADLTQAWCPQNAPDGWEILECRLRRATIASPIPEATR